VLAGESAGKTKGFLRVLGVDVDNPLKLSEFPGLRAVLDVSVRKEKDGSEAKDNNIDGIEPAESWSGAAPELVEANLV